jgi:cell division protein FtsQ
MTGGRSGGGVGTVPHAPPGPGRDGVQPVHPRFRRRRIEVTREEGRRRLRFVAACLGVAAAIGGAVGASRSPLLDVDAVELRGARHTAVGDVRGATGLGRHPLMVEVDPAGVARRVEALPWVLRARARRRWPGTVVVDVRERTAVAAVAAPGGRWALADGTGRILALEGTGPAGLPAVRGAPAPGRPGTPGPASAARSLRVAAALPAPLRPRVAEVVADPAGELELHLRDPGGVVRLGPADQLPAKLSAALTVLEKVGLGGFTVLDVRVPAAPVLTRR